MTSSVTESTATSPRLPAKPAIAGLVKISFCEDGFCSASSILESEQPLYWKVTNPTLSPSHLQDLPGFTRSVYKRDHALITPESHVFSPLPEWTNTLGAYLITPSMGSHFVMYLAKMPENAKSGHPPTDVESIVSPSRNEDIDDVVGPLRDDVEDDVRDGADANNRAIVMDYTAQFTTNEQWASCEDLKSWVTSIGIEHGMVIVVSRKVDSYAYLPPNSEHSLKSDSTSTLVVFERRHEYLQNHPPEQIIGTTDKQPLLETQGEVFELRKLIPTSLPYDFNIHIMDFQPGEFLNVKEVHYNQHGLLLLEGQGIYRLGDSWYPVQAGDAIWMAPFVPQWYAALGKTKSRYLLYKDVNRNPL
ncbi:hypothetical protein CASFOL_022415 [Castilleja foliolosa]|uniref:Cupin type-2 domain-containing protein n=1 Tax=Castilleja foliolosa TaxID=1961234 RepID=A0ABD3CUH3_9LAMI